MIGKNAEMPMTGLFWHPCPIRDVLDRIGNRWSLLILEILRGGPMRFNRILAEIGDISKKMLSQTLKRLEQDGYVARQAFAEVPLRVEYQLTAMGHSFLIPMAELVQWAENHRDGIAGARRLYQEAQEKG